MSMVNRSGPLPALVGAVSLALAGCPAATSEAPPGPRPAAQVESVDASGLVVFTGGMPDGVHMGFGLLNPRAGKATALRQVVADSGSRIAVAGSPDGRTIAWVDASNVLHVGTLGLDAAGLPTIAETATHKVTSSDALAFTGDGRRLYTTRDYVDPEKGPVPCDKPEKDLRVDAGGLRWIGHCGGHDVLFDDRTPTLALRAGGRFSNDGQWLLDGEPLHVPSRSLSAVVTGDSTVGRPNGYAAPDNLVADEAIAGLDGRYVRGADLQWAAIDEVKEAEGSPAPVPYRSLDEVWSPGGVNAPAKGALPVVPLDGFPASEGRGWYVAGPLPDASADLVFYAGWVIGYDGTTPYQQPVWGQLVEISRQDGSVRRHAGTTLLGGPRPWASFDDRVYGAAPKGCLTLGEDGWACAVVPFPERKGMSTGGSLGGWLGARGGSSVEWGVVGELVTPDGRHFVRAGSADGQGRGICFTSAAGDRATSCIDRPELVGMMARLVVGHAVAPAPGGAASVAWVSRQAGYPGLEVRVFGSRFGSSGTLRIGEAVVPAANVSLWTEGEIVFTLPEGLPKAGRVLVDAGQGSDTGARGFHLWASTRWTGPLDGVPDGVTTVHQGLSALPSGLHGSGRTYALRDYDRHGPDLHVQTVAGRFLLDDDGLCPTGTLLWIDDGPYTTNRPVACTGKLDPSSPWTLLPGPQVASADPAVSGRAQQFYGELLLVRDTGLPPMYGKPSWTEFVQTIDGSAVPGAIYQGAPGGSFGAFPGVAAQGSIVELDDQSVLWPAITSSFRGAHRVVALDSAGRGSWTVRAPTPTLRVPFTFGLRSMARVGNVLVGTGSDESDNVRPAFAVSRDLVSFGPVVHGAVSTAGSFAPVFAIQGGRRKGFVGVYREGNDRTGLRPTDGPRSLYTIGLDGTLTEAALPIPPDCETLRPSQLDMGVVAARLFAWNRRDGRLFSLDTNAESPSWVEADFGGRPVTSFMVDARRQRAFVAARDTLWRSSTDGSTFEPWPAPVVLPLDLGPVTYTLFALDKDGYAHVGVAEWTGSLAPAPVTASLVGRPVP